MALQLLNKQIETMGDLKKAISLWADRDDDEFNNSIVNFINFAEKDIYRRLKIPSLEREVYLNVRKGMCHIPTDMIQIKYIINIKTLETFRVTGIEEVQGIRNGTYQNPIGDTCFARLNRRLVFSKVFDAPSDGLSSGDVVIGYVSDTPELIKDTDSCNILTIAPDLVLYMALKHACLYVQDDDGAQKYGMLAEAALAVVQQQANNAEYSGSPMVMPRRSLEDTNCCDGADYPYAWVRH